MQWDIINYIHNRHLIPHTWSCEQGGQHQSYVSMVTTYRRSWNDVHRRWRILVGFCQTAVTDLQMGKLKEMIPQLWVSMILDMFLGVPLFIYYGITEVKLLCMICGLSRWGIKRPNSEWMHNSRLWDAFFMYKTWQSNHRVKFIGSKKSGNIFFTWDPTDPVY